MADTDEIQEQEEQQEPAIKEGGEGGKRSMVGRLLPWIIMLLIVVVCAGAGFGLGRLFAASRTSGQPGSDSSQNSTNQMDELKAHGDLDEGSKTVWYYDMEPVVANLNEPNVSRYVRASLTLEISNEVDQKKGTAFLDEKKPILVDLLFVYLSSLRIEDVRGDKNLKSIQAHIRDDFNEKLFPNSKPQIKRVLIKEFPIQ